MDKKSTIEPEIFKTLAHVIETSNNSMIIKWVKENFIPIHPSHVQYNKEETWKEKFKHWLTTNMRIDTSKADVIISHVERYIRPQGITKEAESIEEQPGEDDKEIETLCKEAYTDARTNYAGVLVQDWWPEFQLHNGLKNEFPKIETDAVNFALFIAKESYVTTTLPHEIPQMWQKQEYDKDFKEIEHPELTTNELYNIYKNRPQ